MWWEDYWKSKEKYLFLFIYLFMPYLFHSIFITHAAWNHKNAKRFDEVEPYKRIKDGNGI